MWRPAKGALQGVILLMQARGVAEGIIATVSLMASSGLPCFGRGQPLPNLRKRFHLELSDSQAAAFMRRTIRDAYDKVPCTPGRAACPICEPSSCIIVDPL
jgi:hypothetical protein